MRKHILIPALAAVHLALSFLTLLMGAGAALGRIESEADASSLARGASAAGTALLYPLFIPGIRLLGSPSGAASWVLIICNSLLWAVAVYALLRLLQGRRSVA